MAAASVAALRVEKLTKRFGGVHAVNAVDLEIVAGERCGLMGPNGAGKSSLFDCITGLVKPDGGRVFFNDLDVTRWPMDKRARDGKAVRSFQKAVVYDRMTVEDNLVVAGLMHSFPGILATLLPSRAGQRRVVALRRRAMELLEFVGLAQFRSVPAREMSFGQQKLLQFAKTLMPEPRLILLDEPFAGVNPVLIDRIAQAVTRANEAMGITFLIIEHNIDALVGICPRIVVMNQGCVIADGPGSAVVTDAAVAEAYLGG